jgi:hypothetical protein
MLIDMMHFRMALSFFLPNWASEQHSTRLQPTPDPALCTPMNSELLKDSEFLKSALDQKDAVEDISRFENQVSKSMEAVQNAQWISEAYASFSIALHKISDDENVLIKDSLQFLSKAIGAKYSGYFEIEEVDNAENIFHSRACFGYKFSLSNNVRADLSLGNILQSCKTWSASSLMNYQMTTLKYHQVWGKALLLGSCCVLRI